MATKPASLPRWATDGGADIDEPSEGKKDDGWVTDEAPSAGNFNWWFNNVYQWAAYLDDLAAQTFTWTGAHTFSGGITPSKMIGTATAAPVAGAHVRGEYILNSLPADGSSVGWVCISSGTPGSWREFGNVLVDTDTPAFSTLIVAGTATVGGLTNAGNGSLGGSLTVTGGTTLSSTLGVTGASTLAAVSATTLATSGLATFNAGATVASGTLTTGLISAGASSASSIITAVNGGAGAAMEVGGGHLKFSGSNPSSSTAFTNFQTPANIVKAFARVGCNGWNATGGVPKLGHAFNVSGVAYSSGRLRITFANAVAPNISNYTDWEGATDATFAGACVVASITYENDPADLGTEATMYLYTRWVSSTVLEVTAIEDAPAGTHSYHDFSTNSANGFGVSVIVMSLM